MTDVPNIQRSMIDEERFGFRTARAIGVKLDHLPAIDEFCRVNGIQFLFARCSAHDLSTVQAMENNGYRLMDTLVNYARRLNPTPLPPITEGLTIRPVRENEAETIGNLGRTIFHAYGGHYHADQRLDRDQCDEVYASWAYRSCIMREVADEVLVAEREGQIAGFLTLRLTSPTTGEGPLFGVSPTQQGHGIGRSLMIGALNWFTEHGAERMIISTQIINLYSQKVWIRLGFEPQEVNYTFHRWYD